MSDSVKKYITNSDIYYEPVVFDEEGKYEIVVSVKYKSKVYTSEVTAIVKIDEDSV